MESNSVPLNIASTPKTPAPTKILTKQTALKVDSPETFPHLLGSHISNTVSPTEKKRANSFKSQKRAQSVLFSLNDFEDELEYQKRATIDDDESDNYLSAETSTDLTPPLSSSSNTMRRESLNLSAGKRRLSRKRGSSTRTSSTCSSRSSRTSLSSESEDDLENLKRRLS